MDLTMKTITTSKGEFVVVDVSSIGAIPYIKLLAKNKLICKLSEATYDDAKLIVDEPEYIPCYNCLSGCPVCSGYGYSISWINELHSLLKSKGIDINNGNWYLFKKV